MTPPDKPSLRKLVGWKMEPDKPSLAALRAQVEKVRDEVHREICDDESGTAPMDFYRHIHDALDAALRGGA